jgi:hyperosmotically inducible protein
MRLKDMKNLKFLTHLIIASIFFAPAIVFAQYDDSEVQFGEFEKDSAITVQIKSKLASTETIDSRRIKVDTNSNGIVLLTGTVKNVYDQIEVHNIAQSVAGVKKVVNWVEINPNPH